MSVPGPTNSAASSTPDWRLVRISLTGVVFGVAPKPAKDLAAEAERADLQSFEIVGPFISRRNQPPMQTPVLPAMNGLTPNGA